MFLFKPFFASVGASWFFFFVDFCHQVIYIDWSGGHDITSWSCNVCRCIMWYQIFPWIGNSNWSGENKISFLVLRCLLVHRMISNMSSGRKYQLVRGHKITFWSCDVCRCITWYQIFFRLPIFSIMHISLIILFVVLLWLIQDMQMWRLYWFSMFNFITLLMVLSLLFQ